MNSQQQKAEFIKMLDKHRKLVYKVARSYAKREEDRKDLIQEITLQLWRSFSKYDNRAKHSTWIYRIALNVSISFYRKETKRMLNSSFNDKTIIAINEEGPDEMEENVQRLYKFIGQLKVIDKGLMLLYLEGKSHEEIGSILGISKSNVGTRISRIKQQLKKHFESIKSL